MEKRRYRQGTLNIRALHWKSFVVGPACNICKMNGEPSIPAIAVKKGPTFGQSKRLCCPAAVASSASRINNGPVQ